MMSQEQEYLRALQSSDKSVVWSMLRSTSLGYHRVAE